MKKIISTASLFLCISLLWAQSVSEKTAQKVAQNFYFSQDPDQTTPATSRITATKLETLSGETLAYIFQINHEGFVIVANEQRVQPILAYGIHEGNASVSDENPEFRYWMNHYDEQIAAVKQHAISQPDVFIQTQWETLSAEDFSKEIYQQRMGNGQQKGGGNPAVQSVSPLLSSTWDQGNPYNYYCPMISGTTAVTGCVATAMAQVMRYHQHPVYGNGSHSYVENNAGTLSANFGTTTYDWANMPLSANNASTTAQKQAIGRLMSHCGISVDMNYDTGANGGSSASTPDAAGAFSNYFHYTNTGFQDRANYTTANWKTFLKNTLDNSLPILYRGRNTAAGYGHAWVCDGYDVNNYFHMNWGWSGGSNGYFSVDNLTPSSYTFNDSQGAIVNTPKSLSLSMSAYTFCYSAASIGVTVSSNASWTITDNASWITASVVSGSGNSAFLITATTNSSSASRSGTVTVKGGGHIRTIAVTQSGQGTITITPNFYAGTLTSVYNITVSSNVNWTAAENLSWVTLSSTSGTSATTTFSFITTTNSGAAARTGVITLTGPCGKTATINLTQSYATNSCPTVSGVYLSNVSQTSATVNFTANANASFYRVYCKTTNAFLAFWIWKGSYASGPITVSGLSPNTNYQFVVEAACSSSSTGSTSSIVSVTTPSFTSGNGGASVESFNFDGDGLSQENNGISIARIENTDKTFRIYPNPAQDIVNVALNLEEPAQVSLRLWDMSGKIIMETQENAPAGLFESVLSVSELPAGMYILSTQFGNEYKTEKVQVIK